MALQAQVSAFGVDFPEGYIRLTSGSWNAGSGDITANAEVFSSQASADAGQPSMYGFSVSFPIDLNTDTNVFQQAYAAVKARPEFAGAIDV